MAPRPAPWQESRHYGVVIDAGSSGSRVQVYSWVDPVVAKQLRQKNGDRIDVLSRVEKGVEQGDGWHAKVEPGISTFGARPQDVAQYLRPLIDFAVSVVPADKLAQTPIFLLATAGMRLLPDDQQQHVLDAACDYLNTFSFSLPSCAQNVRIISGEEEGLYGWIAVNYLMDGFDKHEHAVGPSESAKHSSTYGFLDMGGASTQIAFEPAEREQVAHADNLTEVKLRLLSGQDVRHPVFVTTWLGFGTNQARDRYIDAAVRAHVRASDQAHAESGGGDSPGADSLTAAGGVIVDDPCLPKDLELADVRHRGYTLKGTGDFTACVRKTGPLLNKEVACLDEPCLFNGVHVPPIDFEVNHFIGISEYYYSTHDVWGQGGVYDFVTFERHAQEYCSRTWSDILKDREQQAAIDQGQSAAGSGATKSWASSVELSRLETQCFKAAWIINILHEGIGVPRIIDRKGMGDSRNVTDSALKKGVDKGLVPEDAAAVAGQQPSFQSLNEVGDVAISWTLGKMVLEVSRGTAVTGGDAAETTTTATNKDEPGSWSRPASWRPGGGTTDSWRGHIPSWSGDRVRSSLATIKNQDPLPLALGSLAVLSFVMYCCCFAPGSSRRRASFGCGPGGIGSSGGGSASDSSSSGAGGGDGGALGIAKRWRRSRRAGTTGRRGAGQSKFSLLPQHGHGGDKELGGPGGSGGDYFFSSEDEYDDEDEYDRGDGGAAGYDDDGTSRPSFSSLRMVSSSGSGHSGYATPPTARRTARRGSTSKRKGAKKKRPSRQRRNLGVGAAVQQANLISRTLVAPVRYGVWRISSMLRSLATRGPLSGSSTPRGVSGAGLPMTSSSIRTNEMGAAAAAAISTTTLADMMRPRAPLRQSRSTPFLRAATAVPNGSGYSTTTTSTNTTTGTGGWNDAPDLSELHLIRQQHARAGTGTGASGSAGPESRQSSLLLGAPGSLTAASALPRSHSTSFLPIVNRTASPPVYNHGSSSHSNLTLVMPTMAASGSGSGSGSGSAALSGGDGEGLASAVTPTLSRPHTPATTGTVAPSMTFEWPPPGSTEGSNGSAGEVVTLVSNGNTSSTTPTGAGTLTSRLRATRSANSSRNDLSALSSSAGS